MNAAHDARRQAGISALAFTLLFGVGSAIWGLDMPASGAPVPEILDWYRDTDDRIVVGGTMSIVAIAVFLWFAAAMRRLLADAAGDDVLATTAFGGGVLAMAAGLGAESINLMAALRAQDGDLTPELAHSLFATSQILGSAATAIGGGVFAIATAVVALRTGVLPRWLAAALLVVGVLFLTPLAHVAAFPGGAMVVLGFAVAVVLLREPR